MTLRPYQQAGKDALRALYRAGKRRCVYQGVTGSGKTRMSCSMIGDAIARGRSTRVLVHRIELVEQFEGALAGAGIDGVPVSMAQTLTRRIDRTPAPDFLVIDECVDGDAIVQTDVGPVRLQDIPTSGATSVVSFDGSGAVWRKIIGWKDSGPRNCMCLHIDDGSSVVCTPDHMVFSSGKWRQAQAVRSGDLITVLADTDTLLSREPGADISTCAQIPQRQEGSGTLCTTTSQRVCSTRSARVRATSHCGQRQVFDISVEDSHCFFANGILVHNCHHATSETWARVIRAWPDAWVLGLTATPARTDGRGLGEIFDGIVCGPSMRELTEQGYLARYRLYAPPAPDTAGLRKRAGDYTSESLSAVFDRPQIVGDVVDHYQRLGGGRQFVAFGVSVDHANNLAAGFQRAGVACEVLHGDMSGPDRARIVSAVKCGSLQGIANCDIVSEGFDVPAIGCVILAGRTLSLIRYLQRIGRGLRPDGDLEAVILDHGGNVFAHGMPDQPREWSLDGVSKKAGQSEVVIRHCPECFAVFAGHLAACPYCGYAVERKIRTLRQQDGELVEVNYWADAPVSAARTIDDLRAIAKARGYHRGWVFHAAKERLKMSEMQARRELGWWR